MQPQQPPPQPPQQPQPYQLTPPQLGVMNQLKEQLEERTRILQADIKTQQQELHDIKEKLQLANIQMLLQQPIHNEFGGSQQPQQQGPGRPQSHQPSGVIRQPSGHSKQSPCGGHRVSPHSLLPPSSPSTQQRIPRSGQGQSVSLPVQTNTSLTMPYYSNPMMFPQNSRSAQESGQRAADGEFTQDGQLRMLLNQPMQTLVPTTNVTTQPSQCNMGLSQTIYTLEQQIIAPSFSNCNAVLVPSQVFTSPIMIPHSGFIQHQSQSAYHGQPQASQQPLQLQQPQQFFQMAQGLVHGGSTPAFLHTTNLPQQGAVGYIQQQQQQQQLAAQPPQHRQYQHSQTQMGSVSDFRNMLTR